MCTNVSFIREIEDVLYGLSGVSEVHVCGVPDVRLGEAVCAWVKAREGTNLTEVKVKEFLQGKVSDCYNVQTFNLCHSKG